MGVTERRLAPIVAAIVGVIAYLAGVVPSAARGADAQTIYPIAAIGVAGSFSAPATDGTVYYASARGLFRSADPTYATWTRQSPISDIAALSVRSDRPDDLIYADQAGIHRSVDGGMHAALTSACAVNSVTRSLSAPSVLYASSGIGATCPLPHGAANFPVRGTVLKSTDDGLTWTLVFTSTAYYEGSAGLGPIAVDPANAKHAIVGLNYWTAGYVYETYDGGITWWTAYPHNDEDSWVRALAFNPTQSDDLWAIWGQNLEHNSQVVDTSGLSMVAFDPLTGRAYAVGETVLAQQSDGSLQPLLLDTPTGSVTGMVITPNGLLLLSAAYTAPVAYELSAGGVWPLASSLQGERAVRLVGDPLSPLEFCKDDACQYFDKGALERGTHGTVAVVPLVPALLNTRSSLPVGDSTSTVTYRTLFALHSQRTPMPVGFTGGTLAMPGGVFVPYSPTLAPASGYVVPAVFWRYLTAYDSAPDGWQQDMGLPLTPAVPATVTKGKLGTRTILVQAFQRAILTYDPRNAASFQVERANTGADYAALFPAAVR